ncbi:Cysteinyl-tRNA synthetase [Brevinematales bacterium NS]|nr:Cysteinyl-tRNA synthetase [Brevinematales bacterium NS]
MPIRFYNSLSRMVEEFVPLQPGRVRLYTCGPTVYNYPHIGNLRTFLFEDLLKRWLLYRGYKVIHVMNLTDVDDKTIRNSLQQGMSLSDYTAIYKQAFFEDIKTLKVLPADHYPSATEYIPQMIEIIQYLLEKGHAYETEDGVYFKISTFPSYGKLAHLDTSTLKAAASGRLSADEYDKESVSDFALWKKWTPEDGDVKWPSPFGEGRPGWHIECSAMSLSLLGETLDIHCGGIDNLFPHHENEIAQSECYTGKPFVRYWLHATHLIVDGEKMSKSKGNFYTLRDLLAKGLSPRAIRYALITTHYRKPLNFTFDLVRQAESSLKRIDDFLFALRQVQKSGELYAILHETFLSKKQAFEEAMDDDLNIAEAMGHLFEMIRAFYEHQNQATLANAQEMLTFFLSLEKVLGFIEKESVDILSPEEEALFQARLEAKKNKDYARADALREELLKRGIEVRDTPQGPVWKRL